MTDTEPEIAEFVREKLLERSGTERIMMASSMFETAKAIIFASFPAGLPTIEVKRRLCERLYGNEVDVNAFIEYLSSSRPRSTASQKN